MAKSPQIARLERLFNAVPETVKTSIARSLETSAQEIVDLAKHLCPVDDGTLRDSIGWTWGDAPEGSIVLAATDSAAMRITIYAGNDEAFYARWVEFGTSNTPPQGFMYPAYRLKRKKVVNRTKRDMAKAFRDLKGKP